MTREEFNKKYHVSDQLINDYLKLHKNKNNNDNYTLAGKPKKLFIEVLKRYFSNWIYVLSLIIFLFILITSIVITTTKTLPDDRSVVNAENFTLLGNPKNTILGSLDIKYLPPEYEPVIKVAAAGGSNALSVSGLQGAIVAWQNPQFFGGVVYENFLKPYVNFDPITGVYHVNIYKFIEAKNIAIILNSSADPSNYASGKAFFSSTNIPADQVMGYINQIMRLNPNVAIHSILGTDANGIDIWTRSWVGTWNAIKLALIIATAQTIIGVAIGAYIGFHAYTWFDTVMMRVISIITAPPTLVVLLIGVSLFGTTNLALVLVLTFLGWPGSVGITRVFIITVKSQDFISASRLVGASKKRLVFFHALPAIMGKIANNYVSSIPGVIFSISSLAFFGFFQPTSTELGVYPSNLGTILGNAAGGATSNIWILLLPLIILLAITISLQFVALGIHDSLDPKVLRKR